MSKNNFIEQLITNLAANGLVKDIESATKTAKAFTAKHQMAVIGSDVVAEQLEEMGVYLGLVDSDTMNALYASASDLLQHKISDHMADDLRESICETVSVDALFALSRLRDAGFSPYAIDSGEAYYHHTSVWEGEKGRGTGYGLVVQISHDQGGISNVSGGVAANTPYGWDEDADIPDEYIGAVREDAMRLVEVMNYHNVPARFGAGIGEIFTDWATNDR